MYAHAYSQSFRLTSFMSHSRMSYAIFNTLIDVIDFLSFVLSINRRCTGEDGPGCDQTCNQKQ
jgi:hypothetical protein